MSLSLRAAVVSDLPILAQMNKQLIIAEGSSNPMGLKELEERMKHWLMSDWTIELLIHSEWIIGYVVYQFRSEQAHIRQQSVYIRQYFIAPTHRNKGFGSEGIQLLQLDRFNQAKTIQIEVLHSNPQGMSFWQKVGFIPYSTTMNRSLLTDSPTL